MGGDRGVGVDEGEVAVAKYGIKNTKIAVSSCRLQLASEEQYC